MDAANPPRTPSFSSAEFCIPAARQDHGISATQNLTGLKNDKIDDGVAVEHLYKLEQTLLNNLYRVEIKGKRRLRVAILLTEDMVHNKKVQVDLQNNMFYAEDYSRRNSALPEV